MKEVNSDDEVIDDIKILQDQNNQSSSKKYFPLFFDEGQKDQSHSSSSNGLKKINSNKIDFRSTDDTVRSESKCKVVYLVY